MNRNSFTISLLIDLWTWWIILDHTHILDQDQLWTSDNIPDMRCDGLCLRCSSCRKTSNTFDRVTLASQKCLNIFAWIRSFSLSEFCSCNVWCSILHCRTNTQQHWTIAWIASVLVLQQRSSRQSTICLKLWNKEDLGSESTTGEGQINWTDLKKRDKWLKGTAAGKMK